jgi:hypothetical protein
MRRPFTSASSVQCLVVEEEEEEEDEDEEGERR